jgi:hypothetical protein
MDKADKCPCPVCEQRKKEELQSEEFNLAVLVAMVPLLVFTLFGQMGLF